MKPHITLAVTLAYGAVAFGWRSWLQYRRTGSTGIRGIRAGADVIEWIGGALLVVGLACALAAPLVVMAGAFVPWALFAHQELVGVALFTLGFASTTWSQLTMGASWRIGVDPTERTTLIARGPFLVVRNPIFSSMLVAVIGLFLMSPGPLLLAAFVAALGGLELHVRFVEEPYLLRTHGDDYARYAARVGRFVPFVGRRRS